jgi:hypothetical protein
VTLIFTGSKSNIQICLYHTKWNKNAEQFTDIFHICVTWPCLHKLAIKIKAQWVDQPVAVDNTWHFTIMITFKGNDTCGCIVVSRSKIASKKSHPPQVVPETELIVLIGKELGVSVGHYLQSDNESEEPPWHVIQDDNSVKPT